LPDGTQRPGNRPLPSPSRRFRDQRLKKVMAVKLWLSTKLGIHSCRVFVMFFWVNSNLRFYPMAVQ
jgi:hypothetical protein